MKNLFVLLLFCLCFTCASDAEVETKSPNPSTVTLPAPKKVTLKSGKNTVNNNNADAPRFDPSTIKGKDLNGDGEPDRLDVVTTTEENDGLGFKRQLVVYTGEGADLDAWYTADATIEDGTIVIKHFGGSRAKWNYTHRFRWQGDDFVLIGTTIENDDPCTRYTKLDYNLSTNLAAYSTTSRECKGDKALDLETVTVNFSATVFPQPMNGFKTGENELKADGMTEAIFF